MFEKAFGFFNFGELVTGHVLESTLFDSLRHLHKIQLMH